MAQVNHGNHFLDGHAAGAGALGDADKPGTVHVGMQFLTVQVPGYELLPAVRLHAFAKPCDLLGNVGQARPHQAVLLGGAGVHAQFQKQAVPCDQVGLGPLPCKLKLFPALQGFGQFENQTVAHGFTRLL